MMKWSRAVAGAAALALAAFLSLASLAAAQTANQPPSRVDLGAGDLLYNYDFRSQWVNQGNVDWAVSIIFYGGGTKPTVFDRFSWKYAYFGGTQWGISRDGAQSNNTWGWQGDGGRKSSAPCTPNATHYRLYSHPGNNTNYNLALGFWTFATTHRDYWDGCPGQYFGYSENAEHEIVGDANSMGGTVTFLDHANFGNPEPARWQGNHYWLNDGMASYIRIY
jgi:hypothetical protein